MSDFGADRRDHWQSGQQQGDPRRAYESSERYDYGRDQRVPEPRESEARYASLADLSSGPRDSQQAADWNFGGGGRQQHLTEVPRGPRSGEPLPPLPPPPPMFEPEPAPDAYDDALREPTGMVDSAAVRRSVAETDGLYRSQRPAMAVLFGALAVIGEMLALLSLVRSKFDMGPLVAMAAFPLIALGLYAVSTGAATAVQFQGPRVWLRTPLVYLPIGIALLIAAL